MNRCIDKNLNTKPYWLDSTPETKYSIFNKRGIMF